MSAHKYELMFIADPELDERGLKKLTEQYLETVTKEGGAVENIDIWGRRKRLRDRRQDRRQLRCGQLLR